MKQRTPGEPFTIEMLAELEHEMPASALQVMDHTLYMLSHGHVAGTFVIEKNGSMGATAFHPISDDKTGSTYVLYRLALTKLGVTSAAASMEATQHREDGSRDCVVIMWWTPTEEKTWIFGVDHMGPEPRTLLFETQVDRTETWMSQLLTPMDLAGVPSGERNRIRKAAESLESKLRPLISGPKRDPRFAAKAPRMTQ